MNNSFNIGVVYRATDSSNLNDEAMYKLIDKLYDKKVLVMGDFNFPELDWSDREKLDVSHPFVDCINSNFVEQYCNEPTRDKNYLDLVLCSDEIIQDLVVGEHFVTSDHQIIRFQVKCSWARIKSVKYDYFKADFSAIRKFAKSQKLFRSSSEDNVGNIEVMWTNIKTDLIRIRSDFIKLQK